MKYPIVEERMNEAGFVYKETEAIYDIYIKGDIKAGFCIPCRNVFVEINGKKIKSKITKPLVFQILEMIKNGSSKEK